MRSRLYVGLLLAAQEDEQPSCVLEREAQLALLAAPFMRGRHFFKDQQNVQERTAHLHASSEWTNIPSEVVRLFAHGAGTGVSGTQKVSLCDATICLVASDFFVYSLARRPTGGHQPLLTILCALDVILQKFSNGQHRHAGAVGKHTWLEPPYPKFLEMTLSRLR